MFAPLASYAGVLSSFDEWPDRTALQGLLDDRGVCNSRGLPIRLVAEVSSDDSYEERLYERGELQVREANWHDLFNIFVWLTYPLSKAALNERHVMSAAGESRDAGLDRRGSQSNRGRVRDALTLFDESGLIVASSDPLLTEELRRFRWKTLFWEHRSRLAAAMRFFVFGHALFEKALNPYVGMTAHATTLLVTAGFLGDSVDRQVARCDALVAEQIASHAFVTPRMLSPVPVLGVPGWSEASGSAAFYDDERYFRPGRKGKRLNYRS
jgi:hypothetical protein